MKTLVNITAIALIIGSIISTTQAGGVEKYYEVTKDGQFQYIYRQADASPKTGVKPVTDRTFYLETKRQGLLPGDLSYNEYLELTPQEIQALLNQAPFGIYTQEEQYASVEKTSIENIPVNQDNTINYSIDESATETPVLQSKEEAPYTDDLPWIIKVSVDPTDEYNIPKEFAPMEACTECGPVNVPQVVNDIVDHGKKDGATTSTLVWKSENMPGFIAGK